jgi:hypothetical protein
MESPTTAWCAIGSNNLTGGGLWTNFESCFIYRKNKSEIPRLVNFLKEWDKFIEEKDYDSRLEDIKVSI